MTPDEKIVKYALDLKGIDLDKLMIADSSQILEAFKWLKKNVSGWQANADEQPQEADLCQDIVCCPLCHNTKLTQRIDDTLSCNKCGIVFVG